MFQIQALLLVPLFAHNVFPGSDLIQQSEVCFNNLDSSSIYLTDYNTYRKQNGNFWQSIPACQALQKNSLYKFKFNTSFSNRFIFGISSDGYYNYPGAYMGQNYRSVGLFCQNGYIYQNGVYQKYSSPCPLGQIIEVVIDMFGTGQVWYRIGNNPFNIIWTGIKYVYPSPIFAFGLHYSGDIIRVEGKKYIKK